jgi:hypothetical protein
LVPYPRLNLGLSKYRKSVDMLYYFYNFYTRTYAFIGQAGKFYYNEIPSRWKYISYLRIKSARFHLRHKYIYFIGLKGRLRKIILGASQVSADVDPYSRHITVKFPPYKYTIKSPVAVDLTGLDFDLSALALTSFDLPWSRLSKVYTRVTTHVKVYSVLRSILYYWLYRVKYFNIGFPITFAASNYVSKLFSLVLSNTLNVSFSFITPSNSISTPLRRWYSSI